MQHLAGDAPATHVEDWLAARRREVLARFASEEDVGWFRKQLAALPATYLRGTPPETVAADLRELARLAPGEAVAHGRYLPESNTVEYRVGTYETIAPGVFHKLTGALASHGLQILSAEINTLVDGLIFDRFFVFDPDYAEQPPEERLEAVGHSLVAALLRGDGKTPAFRRVWRPGKQRNPAALCALPTQVRADNSTSDRYTILDIFAADRMGLLYTIARTLFELGLSVSVAKIGTYLDQVVDVFYVTDQAGAKIHDEARLSDIRARLLAAVEELERQETERLRA
jgi:[protein-PII] uridylyltransferase